MSPFKERDEMAQVVKAAWFSSLICSSAAVGAAFLAPLIMVPPSLPIVDNHAARAIKSLFTAENRLHTTAMSQQQKIDLNQLGPQQLLEVRKQINEEVNHFTSSLQALQAAQTKLRDCVDSVDKMSKLSSDDILVPMTTLLYLPGKIKNKNEFLVDIGTGYFVEKNALDAKKVYEKKVEKLNQDSQKLKDILVQKNEMLNSVNLVLRAKMVEYEKQQAAAKPAA